MPEEGKSDDLGILILEHHYVSPEAKIMHKVRPSVQTIVQEQLQHPKNVTDAIELRFTRDVLQIPEFWEDIHGDFSNTDEWQGEKGEAILEHARQAVQEGWGESIDKQTQIINRVCEEVDISDTDHIQLFLTHKKENGRLDDNSYYCVVVYPPRQNTDGTMIRDREFGTLTMGCQTIDIALLLDPHNHKEKRDFLKDEQIADETFTIARLKVDNCSVEELGERIKSHKEQRSVPDRVIQTVLHTYDALKHRQGEHIDPIKAARNSEYAVDYAAAVLRHAPGVVHADMTSLPPILAA
jgi:hypothetical protein